MVTSQPAKLFLWPGRALYLGMGITSTLHQHHALQVGISLGDPFKVRWHHEEEFAFYSNFIALPNQLHEVDASNIPGAFMWLEAENRVARLREQGELPLQSQFVTANLAAELRPLLDILLADRGEDTIVIANAFDTLMSAVSFSTGTTPETDARVDTVLNLLTQQTLAEPERIIGQLASHVHLSASRLRHLFHAQVGISMQRYLLWKRLLTALQAVSRGVSLTDAAHMTGFADSAHLTRTYRTMFGHTPSEIFKNSRFVQVVWCGA